MKFWGSVNVVPSTLFYALKHFDKWSRGFTRMPERPMTQKQLGSTILVIKVPRESMQIPDREIWKPVECLLREESWPLGKA